MLLPFNEDLWEHQHLFKKLLDKMGNLPAFFDLDLLPKLGFNEIVYYDVR
jgi:hypothetical protein